MVQQCLAINARAAQIGGGNLIQRLARRPTHTSLAAILVVIVDDGKTLPALALLLSTPMVLPLLSRTRLLRRLGLWLLRCRRLRLSLGRGRGGSRRRASLVGWGFGEAAEQVEGIARHVVEEKPPLELVVKRCQ